MIEDTWEILEDVWRYLEMLEDLLCSF